MGITDEEILSAPLPALPIDHSEGCHQKLEGDNTKILMPLVLEPKCNHFGQVTSDNMKNLFTSYVDPTQPTYSHMR